MAIIKVFKADPEKINHKMESSSVEILPGFVRPKGIIPNI